MTLKSVFPSLPLTEWSYPYLLSQIDAAYGYNGLNKLQAFKTQKIPNQNHYILLFPLPFRLSPLSLLQIALKSMILNRII